ncbi:MAG: hypothetical protein R3B06_28030 [Kofleriaceae bacterium]
MLRPSRGLWVVVAALACHPPGPPPLAPAGSVDDDGAGGLAALSAKLELAGAGDDDGPAFDDRGRDRSRPTDDPLAYAGYSYGGFGYGGFGYGGTSYGAVIGRLGFSDGRSRGDRALASSYQVAAVGGPGVLEGQLRWARTAGVAWPAGCATARTAVEAGPVVGAVAYLEVVPQGRLEPVTTAAVVTGDRCGLAPAVQVVSTAVPVVILESHLPTPLRVIAGAVAEQAIDLDPGGRVERSVDVTTPTRLGVEGGAPAWVLPLAHPYYAISDEAGRFALDQVPAGAYTLVVWSPPLVTAIGAGGPVWSAPSVVRRSVVVTSGGLATLAVAVAP